MHNMHSVFGLSVNYSENIYFTNKSKGGYRVAECLSGVGKYPGDGCKARIPVASADLHTRIVLLSTPGLSNLGT